MRFFLLLAVLGTGLALVGCDQNAYDTDYDIPEGPGQAHVEFNSVDTTVISVPGTDDVGVNVPTTATSSGGFQASFKASGEAQAGADYTIDNDMSIDSTLVVDTLDTGDPDVLEVDTSYSVAQYSVDFDEDSQTGTIEVQPDPLGGHPGAGNFIDDATITIRALVNDDASGPRVLTLTLTDAQTLDGDPLAIGRPPNGYASTKTIVIGEEDDF